MACIILKEYPGMTRVRGQYTREHNHPIGKPNLMFVQVPTHTRERIAAMLREEIHTDIIVSLWWFYNGEYS